MLTHIFAFLFVVKLIRDIPPKLKLFNFFIVLVRTKLLVYEFGAINQNWPDEQHIVVIFVLPDAAKRVDNLVLMITCSQTNQ